MVSTLMSHVPSIPCPHFSSVEGSFRENIDAFLRLSPRLSDVPGSSSVRLSCLCCSNTNLPQLPFKFPVSLGSHFSILSRKEVSVCYSSLLSSWVTPQLVTPTVITLVVTLSHWLPLDWDGFHVGISGCTVHSTSDLQSTPPWCHFRQEELVRAW